MIAAAIDVAGIVPGAATALSVLLGVAVLVVPVQFFRRAAGI